MPETVKRSPARRRRRRRIRPVWKMIFAVTAVLLLLLIILCLRACFKDPSEETPSNPTEIVQDTPAKFPSGDALPESDASADPAFAIEPSESISSESISAESTASLPLVAETTVPESSAGRSDGLPDIDISDWKYILINADHTVTEKFAPKTVEVEGISVDKRIVSALTEFIEAARAEGLPVYLNSGYRDYARQNTLYKRKCKEYSPKKAATIVAPPGTSEHQSGLACDIIDQSRSSMDKSLEKTATYKWMKAHCAEYGFIVRYPNDKKKITNIIYEPWHFRYVGVEVAQYMTENNLCLEEFVALYEAEPEEES